jgi:hypothetical protein
MPAGIAREQERHVGDVGLDVDRARSGRHDMGIVAGGMAVGADRRDAGDDLLALVIGPQSLHHLAGKDAAIVLEQVLHAALGRAAHLAA